MRRYSKRASKKVERAVTSRKQAIAIGLSEARREGARVPSKKVAAGGKKKTKRSTRRSPRTS